MACQAAHTCWLLVLYRVFFCLLVYTHTGIGSSERTGIQSSKRKMMPAPLPFSPDQRMKEG